MPSVPSGSALLQLAKKTLSRDLSDTRPIPAPYLTALRDHIQNHPDQDHFLVDLDDQGGFLTCLDCWIEVPLAVNGEISNFKNFWEHMATPQHMNYYAERTDRPLPAGTRDDPMDVDDLEWWSQDPQPPRSPTPPTPPPAPPRKRKEKRRIRRTVVLSDGEPIEYSSTEEVEVDEPQPQPQVNPWHEQNRADHAASSSLSAHRAPTYYNAQASGSSSIPYTVGPSPSSSTSGKRPREKRLYQFPDGTVFELTDDEDEFQDYSKRARYEGSSSAPMPGSSNGHGYTPLWHPQPEVQPQFQWNQPIAGPSQSSLNRPRAGGAIMKKNGVVTSYGLNGARDSPQMGHSRPNSPNFNHSVKHEPGHAYQNPFYSGSQPEPEPEPEPWNGPAMPGAYDAHANSLNTHSRYNNAPNSHNANPHHDPAINGLALFEQQFGGHGGANAGWGHNANGFGMGGGIGGGNVPVPAGSMAGYVAPGDFNYNYDEEIQPQVDYPVVAQKDFKDFFAAAMDDLQEVTKVTDAAHELGLPHVQALLPGLEVRLMPHQLIGVAWMVRQEEKVKVRGGILADDMGLGKTLQAIALCMKNPPPTDAVDRTTLIVAPAALLQQWKTEIEQRTSGRQRIFIHHGNQKLKTANEAKQYDFVITTYHTLVNNFPKKKKKEDQGDFAADEGSDDEGSRESWGPLAKTAWYRVIMDEAQNIRNRVTRTSKCAARLDATYRWLLTGTPVTNSLTDLYGLVRFLKLRPFDDWKEFNYRIAKEQAKRPHRAGERAQAMLKLCLLRRSKHAELDGKPILQLPPKDVEIVELEFSAEEREIYNKIEFRQQQKMSKFLKAGTVMKNYAHVLVMLLRLRQACNHPKLIIGEAGEDGERVLAEGEDEFNAKVDTTPEGERRRAEDMLGGQWVKDVKAKFFERARMRIQEEGEEEDTDCPICFDTYVNNCVITSCKHLFCGDCLNDLFKNPPTGLREEDADYNRAMTTGKRSCPVCRGDIFPNKVFKTSAFEPPEDELNVLRPSPSSGPGSPSGSSAPYDPKGKGKAVMQNGDEAGIEDIVGELNLEGEEIVPSTKMVKMAETIKKWRTENPDDKIICYSQWTKMITLVEDLLKKDNIETVRFDGKMSRIARDEAVTQFKKRNGPSIMLISLKCGGVGLNLVEANRVISLDLAWNAATENQAFDRVHRMGQQKDVHVKRLIVRNTVEQRILDLQKKKQSLADAALGEGTGQKLKKLTVAELKALFGM